MRYLKPAVWIVLAFLILGIPATSQAQVAVGISVRIGPPVLPVYVQPPLPAPGYIWTPGYWAYGPDGYYWVPGTWVEPPSVGLLWTPGYWGWGGGVYLWHAGYWGPHIGFYGGINYGFGYGGVGFAGGYWRGGAYYYNTAVVNTGTTVVHNTYVNNTVVNNTTVNRTAYNGGPGGLTTKPTSAELAAAKEPHVQPTAVQTQHQQAASTNLAMLASVNHGQPSVAATPKPGVFKGAGVMAARPASSTPTNTATNRNASTMNSTASTHNTTQTSPKTTQPAFGSQPSSASHTSPPQTQQHQTQPQPQQHQAQQQQQQQQHQAQPQHENKPHKPLR